jgi:hypothetical protein
MFSGFRKSEFQPLHITSHYTSLLGRVGDSAHADPAQRGQPPAERPLPPRPAVSPPCPIAVTVSAYAQTPPAPSPPNPILYMRSIRGGVPLPLPVWASRQNPLSLYAQNAGSAATPLPHSAKPHPAHPRIPRPALPQTASRETAAPRLPCGASGSSRHWKQFFPESAAIDNFIIGEITTNGSGSPLELSYRRRPACSPEISNPWKFRTAGIPPAPHFFQPLETSTHWNSSSCFLCFFVANQFPTLGHELAK